MASTTNINELPMGGDIKMMITESVPLPQQPQQSQQPTSPMTLDQTTINQIVSGLQSASVAGITQLPSRDIPRSVEHITQDPAVQPNYMPTPNKTDYIKESMTNDEMIQQHNYTAERDRESEKLYDELQTPVLLAILYFLFQLPIVRKILLQYLPILFSSDGNININGLGFMSMGFGLSYYFINKAMTVI
jgi:hypothetical protein